MNRSTLNVIVRIFQKATSQLRLSSFTKYTLYFIYFTLLIIASLNSFKFKNFSFIKDLKHIIEHIKQIFAKKVIYKNPIGSVIKNQF